MLRLANVATPATAFTVSVPASVPVDGCVQIAIVTALVAVVTGFPCASSIVTVTAGVIAVAATTFVGCTAKAGFEGAPAVTLNGLLVAPVRPMALAASV